jgi:hypothetical protein
MAFPYGTILAVIPADFTPPEIWPEYGHIADPVSVCRRELLQDNPVVIRWSLWPLTFEQYWGDVEPNVHTHSDGPLALNRIVYWRPLRNLQAPSGWHTSMEKIFRIDGYQKLDGDFTKRWHKNARRDLRIWQENFLNTTHRVEIISFEEYDDAYKKSLVAKREGLDRLNFMKRKLMIPAAKEHTRIVGVRTISTGKIVAGTGVVFSPTYKSSTHLVPFIHEEARNLYAATGLIHYWFEESLKAGCPNVMTTNFWHKGKPKSWKGFSEFKSHFGWDYICYPRAYWRFVRGKLW